MTERVVDEWTDAKTYEANMHLLNRQYIYRQIQQGVFPELEKHFTDPLQDPSLVHLSRILEIFLNCTRQQMEQEIWEGLLGDRISERRKLEQRKGGNFSENFVRVERGRGDRSDPGGGSQDVGPPPSTAESGAPAAYPLPRELDDDDQERRLTLRDLIIEREVSQVLASEYGQDYCAPTPTGDDCP